MHRNMHYQMLILIKTNVYLSLSNKSLYNWCITIHHKSHLQLFYAKLKRLSASSDFYAEKLRSTSQRVIGANMKSLISLTVKFSITSFDDVSPRKMFTIAEIVRKLGTLLSTCCNFSWQNAFFNQKMHSKPLFFKICMQNQKVPKYAFICIIKVSQFRLFWCQITFGVKANAFSC